MNRIKSIAKVKEYTSYIIGRKIPEDTENYTEKEITNMNMTNI